ncbi:MAG: tRNA lysidine(34) synthetase TilS [Bacteroidales bacterium]|nr:tRNA lysidine(34) synthetase TilS [Bacteroidales bacterium]
MWEKFKLHLSQDLKIVKQSRILVAVSGGMDSVALLHLLNKAELAIGVAHVNFKLRGDESDRDEIFVKELTDQYKLPFYSVHFATGDFADKESISIQMAARQLRYEWFEKIAASNNYDFLATAHHLDDQIETFFINLLRGSGIGGLKGIPVRTGIFIRPLLPFHRSEIEAYVKSNRLDFREDSSNLKSDYLRNRIRHHLIPLLEDLQPSFRKVMASNLKHLSSAEAFYREAIGHLSSGIIRNEESGTIISIQNLLESSHPELLLHEILQEYGFTTGQTQQIFLATSAQPGKIFRSETHRLIKDRDNFILQSLNEIDDDKAGYTVECDTIEVVHPICLQFKTIERNIDFHPFADPDKAFLDFDTIKFPLMIRKWKQGDKFKPLGMSGHVKLSDFFIANKMSLSDKEKIWLLTDAGDQILWIIGYRIAGQNRIKQSTKTVFMIEWLH